MVFKLEEQRSMTTTIALPLNAYQGFWFKETT